jgi:hypothetical protein
MRSECVIGGQELYMNLPDEYNSEYDTLFKLVSGGGFEPPSHLGIGVSFY